jgi:hypothetical protein
MSSLQASLWIFCRRVPACAAAGERPAGLFSAEQSAADALTLRRVHRKLLLKQSVALMQRPGSLACERCRPLRCCVWRGLGLRIPFPDWRSNTGQLGGGPSDIAKELVDTSDVTLRKDDNGAKYINQYQIIKELGKGSFGKVKLIKHTETGEQFGLKIFNKNILKKKRMGTRNMLQVSLYLSLSLSRSHSLQVHVSLPSAPSPSSFPLYVFSPSLFASARSLSLSLSLCLSLSLGGGCVRAGCGA